MREDREISEGVTLFAPVSGKNDNDSGVCCLASAGEYDILITGDLSKMAEYRVLARHALPDIELLVAGHHGAKTSTSEALLEITQPETVFLSVGEGNRYGHPAAETLETIEKYGAEVLPHRCAGKPDRLEVSEWRERPGERSARRHCSG